LSGDTTVVVSVSGHPDVTIHTPRGSPRVLHDPVVLSVLRSITDDEDTMIEIGGRAAGLVVDSRLVELERVERSINGNTDGADGGCGGLKIGFAARLNVLERGDRSGLVVYVVATPKWAFGLIGIASLAVNTVVLDHVLESGVHLTSVTTIITSISGTVEEVLF